jgi:hypothetical protein
MVNDPSMVYADFNNVDEQGRLRLNVQGALRDIEHQALALHDGMAIDVSDGELSASGIVRFSAHERIWVVELDWSKVEDLLEA